MLALWQPFESDYICGAAIGCLQLVANPLISSEKKSIHYACSRFFSWSRHNKRFLPSVIKVLMYWSFFQKKTPRGFLSMRRIIEVLLYQ